MLGMPLENRKKSAGIPQQITTGHNLG